MTLLELLTRDTALRRVANTKGGEYAGPCPFCGGVDRFRVWPYAERPGYWCRGCGKHGDAIQYLREHDGLPFSQACAYLGIEPGERRQARPSAERKESTVLIPPNRTWQERATAFCREAMQQLWSPAGEEARRYLLWRGLSEATIRAGLLGYRLFNGREEATRWGLAADEPLWIPAGIVIPCLVAGTIWRVEIRRWAGAPRYFALAGSRSALYQADLIDADKPVMVLESKLDALLVQQEAGDLVTACATDGRGGARHPRWIGYLRQAERVILSYDADGEGEKSLPAWKEIFPQAQVVFPWAKDPSDMQMLGLPLRAWVERALAA